MTRLFNKFAESIAGRIKSVEVVKNMIILLPTEFIVRGFLFERTSVKNAYYLWRLIVPLFSPVLQGVALNYSKRISLDGRTQAYIRIDDVNDGVLQEMAETLIFEQVPNLSEIDSIQDFLSEFKDSGLDWRPNTKLDMAFARLLCGELERGEQVIGEILQLSLDSPIVPLVQAEAKRLLEASRQGPYALQQLADEIREKNASALFPGITLKEH
jgi:hypothetical protein